MVAYMDCTFAEDIAAADAGADCTAFFWTYLVACLALPADDDSSCRLGKISRRCPKRVLSGEQAPARCSTVVGGAGWLLGIEIVSASKIKAEVFYEEKVE
jgi:hypothetical protein